MNRGIGAWVTKRAFLQGDSKAFVAGERTFTYADADRRTDQLASALAGLGVRRGDRVAALMVNSVEFLETLLACAKLGAIMVPINVRLAAMEVGFILGDSGADVLVFNGQFTDIVRGALTEPGVRVRHTVQVGDGGYEDGLAYDELLASGPADFAAADVAGTDTAMLMYTSGTTGRPKGAMLTHDNLLWNAINVLGTEHPLSSRDVTVTVAPMFHIGGLGVHSLPLLYVGGTNVILPNFDPVGTLTAMAEHRATVQFMVPAMWVAITQVPNFGSYDLSSLELAMGGGAPCPLPMIEFLNERGVPFIEGFGMTETAPLVSILDSAHARSKAGSIGRVAMHVEARIVDDDDRDVPTNTVGELVLRGPNIFAGYWMRPEATAEAFRNGWFHTGDLGRMDEEGYITLVDRKKDMIISGGENVYPIEVEQVLFKHPKVADAAVVGGPDPRWGERVVAVVVPDPAAGRDPAPEELVTWCRERLAHFKCPREVHFVDALPRNATGKLLKTVLREKYAGVTDGVVVR
ncbi:acyl-CoA synthetase [Prauserella muralis]|uniref:O-succinylbenzoate--CoA ligase n=1 Tax=Prauserella muralis TaxID=588067 RepID=A0A2V4AE26_9PSEU|nr:long-chain fatty acid--CoA ligase [Prauserella muralis]PXY17455.1 o-succinylbenzoate--CoA ligase [Prauserella muralis]TWE23629.1 fatty-acyl-CoA synthase [Prauserella muralis]